MVKSRAVTGTAIVLALGTSVVMSASPAAAAECFPISGGGSTVITACGTWNSTRTTAGGYSLAKTSSFVWTVKVVDSQYRITKTTINTYGYNQNCPSGTSGVCSVFTTGKSSFPKSALTGTFTIVPVWANKYGLMVGAGRGQASNVDITYCRGTSCQTKNLGNIGFGPL